MEDSKYEERFCPYCKTMYIEPPAISRVDNETLICPDCGMQEALDAYRAFLVAQTKGTHRRRHL